MRDDDPSPAPPSIRRNFSFSTYRVSAYQHNRYGGARGWREKRLRYDTWKVRYSDISEFSIRYLYTVHNSHKLPAVPPSIPPNFAFSIYDRSTTDTAIPGWRAKRVRYDIWKVRYSDVSQVRYFDISQIRYFDTSQVRYCDISKCDISYLIIKLSICRAFDIWKYRDTMVKSNAR